MTTVVILLAIAVGVLTLIVFGLLRTHAEILRALDRAGISLDDGDDAASGASGTGRGAPASQQQGLPSVAGSDSEPEAVDLVGTVPSGGPTKIAVTGVAHLSLLAFLSSGCRTCRAFWDAFAEPDLDLPGGSDTRLVIVGQDAAHDSESALVELIPPGVKSVMSSAAWEHYDVPGSPYFALVDGAAGRIVGAGSALSWPQLRELLQQALADAGLAEDASLKRGASSGARRGNGKARGSRAQRVDDTLRSAGIGPGHPSLYPDGSAPADSNGTDSAATGNGRRPGDLRSAP